MTRLFRIALAIACTLLIAPGIIGQAPVQALFSLDSIDGSPFPSDWFTVPDPTQNTHRRVALDPPDCTQYVSDCQDFDVLNELDGFNIQPRLSIPFSGPIDLATLTNETLFLVSLGVVGPGQDYMPWGTVIGIDQVVWDPLKNTLHLESGEALAQRTRFALIMTRGVHDATGAPIEATDAFRRFRADVREDYKTALLDAMQAARHVGVPEEHIVVASVFTTRSTTAILEKIRDQIHEATPESADFLLGPGGQRTVFNLSDVTSLVFNQQIQVGASPASVPVALNQLRIYPTAVGTLAFGRYVSPDYEVHVPDCDGRASEYIPAVGTRTGVVQPTRMNEIYFSLVLPSGPTPEGGWPVVIFGHGIGGTNVTMYNQASSMANRGVASISINAVGHGSGPEGTFSVSRTLGAPIQFTSGGRAIDQNCDGLFGNAEGLRTTSPRSIVFISDGFRQTAADLMQLVRVIEVGMDADGDGQADLNPSKIYYSGASLGGGYGTVFMGVEPNVRVAVLTAPLDPVPIGYLGVAQHNRQAAGPLFAARVPSLINYPGIRVLAEVTVGPAPFFDENIPLKTGIPLTVELEDSSARVIQSPVVNSVPGAMAIQAALENYEWVVQAGSPLAYAPHLRRAPLRGVAAKSVIYQIAKGDYSASNPTTTAILRAGQLADRCLYYRHDLAWAAHTGVPPEFPMLPKNPHTFMTQFANFGVITLTAQGYSAAFFASDGTIDPVAARFFEFPIADPLPEDFNFIK